MTTAQRDTDEPGDAGEPRSRAEPRSYAEWKEAALAEDERTGAARWRRQDPSRRYDYRVIRYRYNELRKVVAHDDPHELMFYLNEGIHGNMGGMGRASLYSRARFGTKDLITHYIAELADALEHMAEVPDSVIAREDKLDFFRRASHCFGRAALMLSGGGSLGPFHLGVAKTLIEQGLLPSVISGASAGSFVAALLGTHPESELLEQIESRPAVAAQRAVSNAGVPPERGHQRMSIDHVRELVETLIPDLTFQEAFDLTGREINISVSPAEVHQSSRLLNAITSPNVMIREAVLASCSIPGIYPPVTLHAKGRDGLRRPYVPTRKWVDGSISGDLPERRLARLYGVNYFITSQTNPIVRWAMGDTGWDDSLLARIADIARATGREWARTSYPTAMQWLKNAYPVNVYVRMLFSLAMQDYTADVNIMPRQRFWDPRKLLAALDPSETRALIQEGEISTWPKVEMIRNCTRIGRTLDRILLEYELQTRRTLSRRRAPTAKRPRPEVRSLPRAAE